jgi:hypothetical protein
MKEMTGSRFKDRRQFITGLACFGAGAGFAGVGHAIGRQSFGPTMELDLASVDFVPAFSSNYAYVPVGGVRLVSGEPVSFLAAVHLPVGTRLKTAFVYLNPNGAVQRVFFVRYNPWTFSENIFPLVSSTAGTTIEEVPIVLNHIVEKDWTYRLAVSNMTAGGANLHGGRIEYRLRV